MANINPLRKDITRVLLLKVIALFLLWLIFFHHPEKTALTTDIVAKRLLQ